MNESDVKISDLSRFLDSIYFEIDEGKRDIRTILYCINEKRNTEEMETVDGVISEFSEIEEAFSYSFNEGKRRKGGLQLQLAEWYREKQSIQANCSSRGESFYGVGAHSKVHMIKAHLFDCSLEVKYKRGQDFACNVIDEYMSVVSDVSVKECYRRQCLRRAWELSCVYGLVECKRVCLEEALGIARHDEEKIEVSPRNKIQILKILIEGEGSGSFEQLNREEIKSLLKSARGLLLCEELYDSEITDMLVDLAVDDKEISEAREYQVQGCLSVAKNCTGVRANIWRSRAEKLSKKYGLHSLHNKIVQDLQDNPIAGDEFSAISTEIVIPESVLHHFDEEIACAESVGKALSLWLSTSSPTGKYEDNLKWVNGNSWLKGFFPAQVIYDNGMIAREVTSIEEQQSEDLKRLEFLNSNLNGIILANALHAMKNSFSDELRLELTDYLTVTYKNDARYCSVFVDGLFLYWEGRYLEAAFLSCSLIEACIRGLLLNLDQPLYRPPAGNASGHFPSMRHYVERLTGLDFDPDWLRCLESPIMEWRNDLAHGHKFDVKQEEVAVMLRVAGLFVILTHDTAKYTEDVMLRDRLRDPIIFTCNASGVKTMPYLRMVIQRESE